ncbi:MAG: hypothetical protein J3K34DRAFT_415886 [Monoraphidium minutum]|nr:MAG: hypothetical protein J3K34DRAFT_415886 [Monoraphidium minutum]
MLPRGCLAYAPRAAGRAQGGPARRRGVAARVQRLEWGPASEKAAAAGRCQGVGEFRKPLACGDRRRLHAARPAKAAAARRVLLSENDTNGGRAYARACANEGVVGAVSSPRGLSVIGGKPRKVRPHPAAAPWYLKAPGRGVGGAARGAAQSPALRLPPP